MTTLNIVYGSSTPITCTTTSLVTDSTLLSGRQSNIVDNSTALAVDAILGGTIASGSGTLLANTAIELWIFGSWDNGTTFSAGAASGGDANLSFTSTGGTGQKGMMGLGYVLPQIGTSAITFDVGPISIANLFAAMPDHWGFFVVHNTGQNLGATTLKYRNITYTNA